MIIYSPQGMARAGGIDANIGGDPVEIFSYTNPAGTSKTFQIGIELNAGPAPGLVKYVYFDDVTVNAEQAMLRENRLRLLSQIRAALAAVADFSLIEDTVSDSPDRRVA